MNNDYKLEEREYQNIENIIEKLEEEREKLTKENTSLNIENKTLEMIEEEIKNSKLGQKIYLIMVPLVLIIMTLVDPYLARIPMKKNILYYTIYEIALLQYFVVFCPKSIKKATIEKLFQEKVRIEESIKNKEKISDLELVIAQNKEKLDNLLKNNFNNQDVEIKEVSYQEELGMTLTRTLK